MVQMFGWSSAEAVCASEAQSLPCVVVLRQLGRQELERDRRRSCVSSAL